MVKVASKPRSSDSQREVTSRLCMPVCDSVLLPYLFPQSTQKLAGHLDIPVTFVCIAKILNLESTEIGKKMW